VASRPAFSVVVPTRDRPDFVRWALEALRAQTFGDFEVIVSDNHTEKPCRAEVESFDDERFVYVAPSDPLPMADNWEFATTHARGEYTTVVTDKTLFFPSALELASRAIEGNRPDIVNWWTEGFDPIDESVATPEGFYRPYFGAPTPRSYDPREILRERLAFAERRGSEEASRYFLGKVCFGALRRGLIDRIAATTGRLFHPIAPDYTSMVPALCLAERVIDLGRPLQLTLQVMASNGRRQARDPGHARRFLLETDPSGGLIDALPLPGLYASVHNVVAHDYVASLARCPHDDDLQLGLTNLLRRAREDLALMRWTDRSERASQYTLLEQYEREHGVEPARQPVVRDRLRRATIERRSRSTRVGRVVRRMLGRSIGTRYPSVVDAVRAADAHYAAVG
jgi:hypothetical protein